MGECELRVWEDCLKYGFLSAGGDKKYSDPIRTLERDDIVVAYLSSKGYVGVGKVTEKAKRVFDFQYQGKPLSFYKDEFKKPNIFTNAADNNKTEYLVQINWIKTFSRDKAKWQSKANLFAKPSIKASLENQVQTIEYIEKEFGIKFEEIMNS